MKLLPSELGRAPASVPRFIGQILLLVLAYSLLSNAGMWAMENFEPLVEFRANSKGKLFTVFASAILIHIVLWPLTRFVLKRKYISLALPNGRVDLRHITLANLFALALFLIAEPIFIALNWPNIDFIYTNNFASWLTWIIPFIIIIFIQVTAEEMFFRGYLSQYIANFTSKRWLYIGIPALLWTLPHWSNISGIHLQIPFLIFIFTLAIILGDIADRTQSLVFPIALHFFFNVFTACIYGNSLRSSSMLIIKADYANLPIYAQSSYYLMTSFVLIGIYFLFKKRF